VYASYQLSAISQDKKPKAESCRLMALFEEGQCPCKPL
jgi:hypothetical protein